jgi:hypothetical protein
MSRGGGGALSSREVRTEGLSVLPGSTIRAALEL